MRRSPEANVKYHGTRPWHPQRQEPPRVETNVTTTAQGRGIWLFKSATSKPVRRAKVQPNRARRYSQKSPAKPIFPSEAQEIGMPLDRPSVPAILFIDHSTKT